jgi:competence protein ComGC
MIIKISQHQILIKRLNSNSNKKLFKRLIAEGLITARDKKALNINNLHNIIFKAN